MASVVSAVVATAFAVYFIPAVTAAAANCTVISCTNPLCETRPLEMRCTCQPGYKLVVESLTCEEHSRVNNVLWPVFLTVGVIVVVGAVAVQIRRSRRTTRRRPASQVADNTRLSMDDDPPSYTDVMSGSAGSGRSRGDSSGSSSSSGSGSDGGHRSSESGEMHSDSSSSLSTVFVCSLSDRDLSESPPPPSYAEATLMLMLASQTGYPPPYTLDAIVTLK